MANQKQNTLLGKHIFLILFAYHFRRK